MQLDVRYLKSSFGDHPGRNHYEGCDEAVPHAIRAQPSTSRPGELPQYSHFSPIEEENDTHPGRGALGDFRTDSLAGARQG
jgi:hypothetical protein